MDYVWLGLGAALGANGRYLVGRALTERFGTGFPYGTLVVNMSGSFLIGLLAVTLANRFVETPQLRLFLIVGVLGGYTTFSSFSHEAISLIEQERWAAAVGYIGSSVALSVAACAMGLVLGRTVTE
jgi:CrcB protein